MSNGAKRITAFLALLMMGSAFAIELSGTRMSQTETDLSATDEYRLTPTELARSRAWDLSPQEWHRYKQLMQGIRASISPATISPIEVLGIHARDETERRRYAERWVHAMREDVGRILAFQHAYDEAGKRLYPDEPLIDPARLPGPGDSKGALQSSDRVLFFTRPDCPACDALWNRLRKRVDDLAGIDIYITGVKPGDDPAVRAWAAAHGIDPAWVRSRRITLNHEAGALQRLTQGKEESPYLLRLRDEALSPLRPSAL
ncbi:TIGR03759 family integrating conjugative element protein [Sedimenticola selenatireducens]|uniref:TIGR03759 family integrating conjugative element protein n=1 Tax=Sedimenticola selenatireducens TaxID=191960 RepID=UPI00048EEB59|nr:TIGR03759 family integrating conjugative element protein [Sedimenticola selenatireducens]